jgi:hypothetical protein
MMLQWNAVALWAWDIVVDNCAICRNHIMDLCKLAPFKLVVPMLLADRLSPSQASSAKRTKHPLRARSAQWPGVSAM